MIHYPVATDREGISLWRDENGHSIRMPDPQGRGRRLRIAGTGRVLCEADGDGNELYALQSIEPESELGWLRARRKYHKLCEEKAHREATSVFRVLTDQQLVERIEEVDIRWDQGLYGMNAPSDIYHEDVLAHMLEIRNLHRSKGVELDEKIAKHPQTAQQEREKLEKKCVEYNAQRARQAALEKLESLKASYN